MTQIPTSKERDRKRTEYRREKRRNIGFIGFMEFLSNHTVITIVITSYDYCFYKKQNI